MKNFRSKSRQCFCCVSSHLMNTGRRASPSNEASGTHVNWSELIIYPVMAGKKRSLVGSKRPKLVQSVFAARKLTQVTCPECNFQYISRVKESEEQHRLFHEEKISGLKITKTTYTKLLSHGMKVEYSGNQSSWSSEKIECFIVSCVDPQIVRVVSDMLKHVNELWLNSTNSSNSWKKRPVESKVVLLVSSARSAKGGNHRLIGIVTTDPPPPLSAFLLGYRMHVSTSAVDRKGPPLKLQLGVSRIFVSQKYRRHHLATFMLDSLLEHAVYGTTLTPSQVGFSQPSNAGSRLLSHWSSAPSSSSSDTVLVYEEET